MEYQQTVSSRCVFASVIAGRHPTQTVTPHAGDRVDARNPFGSRSHSLPAIFAIARLDPHDAAAKSDPRRQTATAAPERTSKKIPPHFAIPTRGLSRDRRLSSGCQIGGVTLRHRPTDRQPASIQQISKVSNTRAVDSSEVSCCRRWRYSIDGRLFHTPLFQIGGLHTDQQPPTPTTASQNQINERTTTSLCHGNSNTLRSHRQIYQPFSRRVSGASRSSSSI